MPKLFKVTAYIVDYNDEFRTEEDMAANLSYCTQRDLHLDHIQVKSADIGEWYDEHPLNYINCPKAEYEKYFKEK